MLKLERYKPCLAFLPYVFLSLFLAFMRPIPSDEAAGINYALMIRGYPPKYEIGESSKGILYEPPLYHILISPFAPYPIIGRISSFLMGLWALINLRKLGGSLAVVIFSLIPVFLIHSSMVRNDALQILFISFILLYATQRIIDKRMWSSVALGVNSKMILPAAVAPLFLLLGLTPFALFMVVAFIGILPFAAYTYLQGDLLHLSYWCGMGVIGTFRPMYDSTLFYMCAVCLYGILKKKVEGWREPMAVVLGNIIFYEALGVGKITSYLLPAYFSASIVFARFVMRQDWKGRAFLFSILAALYAYQAYRCIRPYYLDQLAFRGISLE